MAQFAALDALRSLGLSPEKVADPLWRLRNLYTIITDAGQRIPFRPNAIQEKLFKNWWYLNLVLKSRQHGMTTAIDLVALDQCVFIPNYTAGIIADTQDNVEKIFRKKVLFPWEQMPAAIRAANPVVKQTQTEIVWSNGSSISVGLSLRGGTAQFLHVSELGPIARRFPEKAKEINSGAFEAVAPGQTIVVESTVAGNGGLLHELSTKAQHLKESGRRLTPLDFRLHFFPWFEKPTNTMSSEDAAVIPIPHEMKKYFGEVEKRMGVTITPEQRAWYVIKHERMGEDTMRQEHPSTPEEPFQVAAEGTYLAAEMAALRKNGRLTRVPLVPGIPVNSFWDWGLNDNTFSVFHQRLHGVDRFIFDYENNGEPVNHYARVLRETGYPVWGTHFGPHDFDHRRPGVDSIKTLKEMFEEAGIRPIEVLPRIPDKRSSINMLREVLPNCMFDNEECARTIECLDNYSKEWNDKIGDWRDTPLKSPFNHGADTMQQFAMASHMLKNFSATSVGGSQKKRKTARQGGWRTA